MMTQTPENFNPTETELLNGVTLIEASAGTGKTYTIALLALRFVVEKDIDIKQILVVTFTTAATEELKDRIRRRFVETRLYLLDNNRPLDDSIKTWLDELPLEKQDILTKISTALLDIDQAGIFTIHSFCRRTLTEHSLESGQLFDSELTTDISNIQQACSDDFWRQTIYERSAWEASLLTANYQTPDKLLDSIRSISANLKIIPEAQNIDSTFSHLNPALIKKIQVCAAQFSSIVDNSLFKNPFRDNLQKNYAQLLTWLNKESLQIPDLSLFNEAQFIKNFKSGHFKKSKSNPLSAAEQKQNYVQALTIDFLIFEKLQASITNISLAFRRMLLDKLHSDVSKQLQLKNTLSFNDLITRLADALKSNKGEALCHAIQQHYKVALIDEFQDTDSEQWHIFSNLFAHPNHFLYLIGDPKQAIYKFRGADIHSYFSAKQKANYHFNLGFNWRSHPKLVQAVNQLFDNKNPFSSDHLHFYPVQAGLNKQDGEITKNQQKIAPLVLSQLNKSEKAFWSSGNQMKQVNEKIQISVVNEILDLLKNEVAIYTKKTNTSQPIKANDIAILVRSNKQAKDFQKALNSVNITAVIKSKESVFSSLDAHHLYKVLLAIINPSENQLLKQAMSIDWFNLDGQQLLVSLNDEKIMEGYLSRFLDYQLTWQTKGFMTMMQQFFNNERVYPHLCRYPEAERRMTNLQHCIELIQQAAIENHTGLHKTVDWLRYQLTKTKSSTQEEQELRLESDDNAIKIMTVHSAKGLEFPIVFYPFSWERNSKLAKEKLTIKCYSNNQMIADIGSDDFEKHREIALQEELQEELRIFYVAATRAKYRCYLYWADVRTEKIPNHSAMAYLFDFMDTDFQQQQHKLQTLANEQNNVFSYQLIETEQQIQPAYHPAHSSKILHHQELGRSLYNHWQMSSYSALSYRNKHESAPEIPSDKAQETNRFLEKPKDEKELPRGTHTGNVLHYLLENTSFKALANGDDISEQRDKACLYYGLKTDNPEKIDQLLNQTVKTPLSIQNNPFCLQDLTRQQCLKEMPFYLSMKKLEVDSINHILKDDPAYQTLTKKTMSGYLTGFIDLICEYQGKYYIIDYKSNGLNNYQQTALTQSMQEHNYALQYWIYTLVLHQYLHHRLPNYDYEQHVGGVMYLFLRGMDENQPNSGVYQTRPSFKKIQQLAQLFR